MSDSRPNYTKESIAALKRERGGPNYERLLHSIDPTFHERQRIVSEKIARRREIMYGSL